MMSVNPGFGGQKFILPVLEKIKEAKKFIQDNDLRIRNRSGWRCQSFNCREGKQAGATILVAGDAVFKSRDYKKVIKELKGG